MAVYSVSARLQNSKDVCGLNCVCERSQVECVKTQETQRENNFLTFVKKNSKRGQIKVSEIQISATIAKPVLDFNFE